MTDKYTGEVAFRVAQADAATIDAGIQGAVEAAEPMARLPSIGGTPPEPGRRPPGCPFAPRCALATAACDAGVPRLTPVPGSDPRHRVACLVTTATTGAAA